MVSESLNRVLDAEKAANELVENARLEAKKIEEDARKQAEKNREEKLSDVMKKEQSINEQIEERSAFVKEDSKKKISQESDRLLENSKANKAKAVDEVIELILKN